jgi:hypothetical protein
VKRGERREERGERREERGRGRGRERENRKGGRTEGFGLLFALSSR